MSTVYEFTDFQLQWLEALESGNYFQCEGSLSRDCDTGKMFCCLGVAAELHNSNLWVKFDDIKEGGHEVNHFPDLNLNYYKDEDGNVNSGELSGKIWKKLGLYSSVGSIEGDDKVEKIEELGFECLAAANDKGTSFKEIARIVRAYPRNFFYENRKSLDKGT